ncbi:MAG: hypothetical protein ACYTFQ_14180 [Planctomycetota bacterium]|jgi:hypothetical protein
MANLKPEDRTTLRDWRMACRKAAEDDLPPPPRPVFEDRAAIEAAEEPVHPVPLSERQSVRARRAARRAQVDTAEDDGGGYVLPELAKVIVEATCKRLEERIDLLEMKLKATLK